MVGLQSIVTVETKERKEKTYCQNDITTRQSYQMCKIVPWLPHSLQQISEVDRNIFASLDEENLAKGVPLCNAF